MHIVHNVYKLLSLLVSVLSLYICKFNCRVRKWLSNCLQPFQMLVDLICHFGRITCRDGYYLFPSYLHLARRYMPFLNYIISVVRSCRTCRKEKLELGSPSVTEHSSVNQ